MPDEILPRVRGLQITPITTGGSMHKRRCQRYDCRKYAEVFMIDNEGRALCPECWERLTGEAPLIRAVPEDPAV